LATIEGVALCADDAPTWLVLISSAVTVMRRHRQCRAIKAADRPPTFTDMPMSGLPKDRTELPSSPVGVLVPRSRAVVSSEEPLWG
jgi:hypothetical protein